MSKPHVLLLVDASPSSLAALAGAAGLARHQHCELIALFVEDRDLHASAGHPFAREISRLSGESRPFDRELLVTRMARQRRQIEAMLTELEREAPLRWRLEVVTGPVFESVHAAAVTADWVVLGKAGWSAGHGTQLGSVARRLLEAGDRRLLLWHAATPNDSRREPRQRPSPRRSTRRLPVFRSAPDDPTRFPGDPLAPVVALLATPRNAEDVVQTAHAVAMATDRPCHLLILSSIDPATLPSLVAWRQLGEPPLALESIDTAPEPGQRSADPDLFRQLRDTPASAVVLADDAVDVLGRPLPEVIIELQAPVIRVPFRAE